MKSRSGGHLSVREITREEAFAKALGDAQTVLADRLKGGQGWVLTEFFKDKSAPYMEIVNEFLNPILERGLAKHAARTKAGPADSEEKTLLDSLLEETTG